ncbi:8-oxoguanine DNA glycosylase [Paenibacillus senegalimassiliensis]|uniref:8-oxoguanine DNA glycosylase n=1 Tax=Paenibacillus senegalimassiliensis TaxID=1737426 RepID=UPI001CA30F5F|nr:hypothetical protein [Paenibacillus senegalimassiliensis]
MLKELWDVYGGSIEQEYSSLKKTKEHVLDEFFFVLLGGFGISYELNFSGLQVLKEQDLFNESFYQEKNMLNIIEEKIRGEFSKKQFSPATSNGQLRKYRYTETKPRIISNACYWLWEDCEWELQEKLQSLNSCESRMWLCNCPGIGMKSASWLLRNTGFSEDCAVFDVHIIKFLTYLGFQTDQPLTEKIYLKLEDGLRKVCNSIGVSLGKMDYLLWLLSRNGFLDYANRGERV